MATITGGAKLEAALAAMAQNLKRGASLKVGVLEGATYPNGTSVALVAAVNEFGAPSKGIPPRPAFRQTVNAHEAEWGPQLAEQLVATDYNPEVALGRMGELIAGELRQSIVDLTDPPNSPVTNLLKQRFPSGGQTFDDVLKARADVAAGATPPAGKPLVQSGHLLNSIDYEVGT